MLLLILLLLRTSLIDEWRSRLPENAPNHFVLNVTPEQVDSLSALLAEHSERQGGIYPMVRGRAIEANGIDAQTWEDEHRSVEGPGPRLRSERNLTWAVDLPDENTVVKGSWWGENETGAMVSLEDDYAESLGLDIGDTLLNRVHGPSCSVQQRGSYVPWRLRCHLCCI